MPTSPKVGPIRSFLNVFNEDYITLILSVKNCGYVEQKGSISCMASLPLDLSSSYIISLCIMCVGSRPMPLKVDSSISERWESCMFMVLFFFIRELLIICFSSLFDELSPINDKS